MAINYELALTNSKGIKKVLSFSGLDFPIVIAPSLLGKPLLTTQAFYFLDLMEASIRIRFENNEPLLKLADADLTRKLEYTIDNYLFEYSKRYPESQLTSHVTELKFWNDIGHAYLDYDERMTSALALDAANDSSIKEMGNIDYPSKDFWYDWCLISNYTDEYTNNYIEAMRAAINKKISVETVQHDELGTGIHSLPLVNLNGDILDFYQASMLEVLEPSSLRIKGESVLVSRGMQSDTNFYLPIEEIKAAKYYDENLLSYYFSGVREHLPISKFRAFYNVLEYFFEDAPQQLKEKASSEREQISCVVRWISPASELMNFINSLNPLHKEHIEKGISTTSGYKIDGISLQDTGINERVSKWLYDIRCAIIHSKRAKSKLIPYSQDEEFVRVATPIIQHLAILCIDRDAK